MIIAFVSRSATGCGLSRFSRLHGSGTICRIFPKPGLGGLRKFSSNSFNTFDDDVGSEFLEVETPDVQDPVFQNIQRVRAQQAYVDEIKTTKFRSARELLELLDEVQDGWWSKDIILSSLSKLTSLARRGDRLKSEVGDALRLSPDTRLMTMADGTSRLSGTEELGAEARYAHVLRCAAEEVSSSPDAWSNKELVAVLRLVKPAAQEADVAFSSAVCDAISTRMLQSPQQWGIAQLTATLQSAATAPGVPLDFVSLCAEQLTAKLRLTGAAQSAHRDASLPVLSACMVAVRDALHFKALAGELGALQGAGQLPSEQLSALQAGATRAVQAQLASACIEPAATAQDFDAVVPQEGDTPAVTRARVHALAVQEIQASLELPVIASTLPSLPQPSWRAVSSLKSVQTWHMQDEHAVELSLNQQRSTEALSSPAHAPEMLQVARFAQSCNELAETAASQLAVRSSSEWKDHSRPEATLKAMTAVAELLPGAPHAAAALNSAATVLSHDLPELDESSCAQCLQAITRVLGTSLRGELSRAPGGELLTTSPSQGTLQLLLAVCHRLSVELQQQLELVGDRTQLTAHERGRLGRKNKQGLKSLLHREQLHYTRQDVVQLVNTAAEAELTIRDWLADAVPGMSADQLVQAGERIRPSSTSDPVELAAASLVALRHVLSEPLLAATESYSARMPPGELLTVLSSFRSCGLQDDALEALAVPAGTAAATGPADVAVAVANEYWQAGYGSELQWVDPNSAASAAEQRREALRATVKRMEASRSGDLASTLGVLQELDKGPQVVSKGDAVLQALQVRVQRDTSDMSSGELVALLGLMSDIGLRHHATFAAAAFQVHERLHSWPTSDVLRFLSSLPPAGEFEGGARDAVQFAVTAASDALTPQQLSIFRGGGLPAIRGLGDDEVLVAMKRTLGGEEGGVPGQNAGPLSEVEPWAAAAAAKIVAKHGIVNSAFTISAVHAALQDAPLSNSTLSDLLQALREDFTTLQERAYLGSEQEDTPASRAMQEQRQEELMWHTRALQAVHNSWAAAVRGQGGASWDILGLSLQAHVAAVAAGGMTVETALPFISACPNLLDSAAVGGRSTQSDAIARGLLQLTQHIVDGPLLHDSHAGSVHAMQAVVKTATQLLRAAPVCVPDVLAIAALTAEGAARHMTAQVPLVDAVHAVIKSVDAVAEEFVASACPVETASAESAAGRCAGALGVCSGAEAGVASTACMQLSTRIAPAVLMHDVFAVCDAADVRQAQTALLGTSPEPASTAALAWVDALDSIAALAVNGAQRALTEPEVQVLLQCARAVALSVGSAPLPPIEGPHGSMLRTGLSHELQGTEGVLGAFGPTGDLCTRLLALVSSGRLPHEAAEAAAAAAASVHSHQLAALMERESADDQDMTQLSEEFAWLYGQLSTAGGAGGSIGHEALRGLGELALARSIIAAADAAGLTSHGVDDDDPAPQLSVLDDGHSGQVQLEEVEGGSDPPSSPPRGFTGKLKSMFDSFVSAGQQNEVEGDESSMLAPRDPEPALQAEAQWCAELHPTEGILAGLTTVPDGSPAGQRLVQILLERSSVAALRRLPADSETLALSLHHAAGLLPHGDGASGTSVHSAVQRLANHAADILSQLSNEYIEAEAVLAAVPAVRNALSLGFGDEHVADDRQLEPHAAAAALQCAMHSALLTCAGQDADAHDSTQALQNCASLASVATTLPGLTAAQAAEWAELLKDSLHTALANAPGWDIPMDSLGGRRTSDTEALLASQVTQVGPSPQRMKRLLQWYVDERKSAAEAAHLSAHANSPHGVQRLIAKPKDAEPAFVFGESSAAQTAAAVSCVREVREAAAALQDGAVPLTPPLLQLLGDLLICATRDSAADGTSAVPSDGLVWEVEHCARLCLPALWAHVHDGLLPASTLVTTCSSLQRLAQGGVQVRAPYSMPPPRLPQAGDQDSEQPSGSPEGNMVEDTASFLLASVLQRHASHVQQTLVGRDANIVGSIGTTAVAALASAPALQLSFADRVNLLQGVLEMPQVALQQRGSLRLLLWGLSLEDQDGDCMGTAALPAATDALSLLRELFVNDDLCNSACANSDRCVQLVQDFTALLVRTASLLAPSHSEVASDQLLDNVEQGSIAAACVEGMLELARLRGSVAAAAAGHAVPADSHGVASPSVALGAIEGCLATAMREYHKLALGGSDVGAAGHSSHGAITELQALCAESSNEALQDLSRQLAAHEQV